MSACNTKAKSALDLGASTPAGAKRSSLIRVIYHADSPFAAHWTPHAQNPIYIDSAKARNGGLLTDGDQRLIRLVTQPPESFR